MPDDSFTERLHTRCADAIECYRRQYPDGQTLSTTRIPDLDAPTAETAHVHESFAALTEVYDDLFGVDSTPYRDTWRDHLVYDCSLRERFTLLTSDLPPSLTLVGIGARYVPTTGHIGVSPTTCSIPAATTTLASELCHTYQDTFDSPTWAHPYLREGFEQVAAVRALEELVARDDSTHTDALAQLAAHQRARTLLEGVLAWGTQQGGITPDDVRRLGVTDAELAELRAAWWWRPLGRIRPRYRWSTAAFLPEYALFGTLLLVSEGTVDEPYARAFAGEHPWSDRVDAIRDITPSWLWRVYHDGE